MKKIGMVVAIVVEINAVLEKYGAKLEEHFIDGFPVKILKNEDFCLYIVKTGAGELSAAAGTQLLISKFGVDFVINFGVVGGLTPEMALSKTVVIEKVVHYDMDTSEVDNWEVGRYPEYDTIYIPVDNNMLDIALKAHPELKKVTCASADKFVGNPARKAELHKLYGADICEMEAAGILLTCNRASVPCLMIKTVSDSITGGADEYYYEINRSAGICLDIADKIMAQL